MLPGRPAPADRLFVARAGYAGFCLAMALVLYSLYVVRDVGLTPFQLVLLGTALELSTFIFEVPTGVFADAVSRRLSVLIATFLFGLGPRLMGVFPTFEGVLVGQLAFGIGWTFMSGAQEAWLADEIGEARAAQVYPEAAQWRQGMAVVGTIAGAGLGLIAPGLPLIVGGGMYMLMAIPLACTMTERPRASHITQSSADQLPSLAAVARDSVQAIRARGLRIPIAVAFLGGAASEAFDRLWAYHLITEIGVPNVGLDEVVLFGGIALLGQAGAFVVLRIARGRANGSLESVTGLLSLLFLLTTTAVVVYALTTSVWIGLAAVLVTRWTRDAAPPFVTAWVNRDLDPATRATVLSAIGQADALGQIGGSPAIGFAATLRGSGVALLGSAVVLAPTVLLVRLGQRVPTRTSRS